MNKKHKAKQYSQKHKFKNNVSIVAIGLIAIATFISAVSVNETLYLLTVAVGLPLVFSYILECALGLANYSFEYKMYYLLFSLAFLFNVIAGPFNGI